MYNVSWEKLYGVLGRDFRMGHIVPGKFHFTFRFCDARISIVHFKGILGILFKARSVGLLEDLPEVETVDWDERITQLNDMYDKNALNCWIACGAYGVLFVLTMARLLICLR